VLLSIQSRGWTATRASGSSTSCDRSSRSRFGCGRVRGGLCPASDQPCIARTIERARRAGMRLAGRRCLASCSRDYLHVSSCSSAGVWFMTIVPSVFDRSSVCFGRASAAASVAPSCDRYGVLRGSTTSHVELRGGLTRLPQRRYRRVHPTLLRGRGALLPAAGRAACTSNPRTCCGCRHGDTRRRACCRRFSCPRAWSFTSFHGRRVRARSVRALTGNRVSRHRLPRVPDQSRTPQQGHCFGSDGVQEHPHDMQPPSCLHPHLLHGSFLAILFHLPSSSLNATRR